MSDRFRRRIEELAVVEKTLCEFRDRVLSLPPLYRDDIAAELRELADTLVHAPPKQQPATETADREASGTVAQRMVWFFLKRKNEAAGIQDIADGVGATTDTVRSILYKADRNKGQFVQCQGGGSTASLWMLAPKSERPTIDMFAAE
jgi:hypothetical protein